MTAGRYRIEYGETALRDLDNLPPKQRTQILRKIERLRLGLHGDIKRCVKRKRRIGCGWATTASCLMLRATLLWFAGLEIGRAFMTKTIAREITRSIGQKRKQLAAIREEVEDLLDYLDVVEAGRATRASRA